MDEQLARENVLDHNKAPRNYGRLDEADATADGYNPLCGDEQTIDLRLRDGRVEEIRFEGRGCSISRAATSMLSEVVVGRPVEEVAAMSSDDVVELIGFSPSPVRLKCAVLGLNVLKVALHRSAGTPLPEGLAGLEEITWD